MHLVNASHFYDWTTYLDKFYRKKLLDVSRNHCFHYSIENNGFVLKRRTINDSESEKKEKLKNWKKKISNEDMLKWKYDLKTGYPLNEKTPGISEIKQVELYLKWRGVIPHEFQDDICPKPEDHVLETIKNEKRDKEKKRIAAQGTKKRKETETVVQKS